MLYNIYVQAGNNLYSSNPTDLPPFEPRLLYNLLINLLYRRVGSLHWIRNNLRYLQQHFKAASYSLSSRIYNIGRLQFEITQSTNTYYVFTKNSKRRSS